MIAVVDGGTDWRHEDLQDNVWVNADEVPSNGVDDDNNGYVDDVNGWNFLKKSHDPSGEPGTSGAFHGTGVAGITAAVTNNSIGIAGAGWNAMFMALNTSCEGGRLLCWTDAGVVYAAENGADVIMASYGSGFPSEIEITSLNFAIERGAVVVAPSGNQDVNLERKPFFPASYPTTLSVGGTEKSSDRRANISSYGRSVDVFAPATAINLVLPGNLYHTGNGTSFAVPLVAGVAALVQTQQPDYGPYEVMEQIKQTADNIDAAQPSELHGLMGRGRVNARRAVTEEPTPGIRMVGFEFTDADGNMDFAPGESFTVDASFVNYGETLMHSALDWELTIHNHSLP